MAASRRATRKTDSLADRTAGIVRHGDGAGSSIVGLSDASPSPAESSDAPTPFYDLLTSMIEAHALDKARNAANDDVMVPARKAGGRSSRSHVCDACDATPDPRQAKFSI